MIGPMRLPLINWMAPPRARTPRAFLRLSTLWIQITGTWCNLKCVHCINASGPADPWLKPVSPEVVRRAIREAEDLGVKKIYFTGGRAVSPRRDAHPHPDYLHVHPNRRDLVVYPDEGPFSLVVNPDQIASIKPVRKAT